MVFKWKENHTPLFLKHFRKYPCLWNHRHESYKDRDQRRNAIQLLIEDLRLEGVTEEDVKLKVKTIRTRYAAEVAKVNQSKERGAGEVYVPKLFWFTQADAFLKSFCTPRNKTLQYMIKQEAKAFQNQQTSNPQSLEEPSHYQPAPSSNRKRIKVQEEPKEKRRRDDSEDDNEFDLFCKSLAVQLKKMPLEKALVCQERLQTVMVQERLDAMSRSDGSYQDLSSSSSPRSVPSPIFVEPDVTYSFKRSPRPEEFGTEPTSF